MLCSSRCYFPRSLAELFQQKVEQTEEKIYAAEKCQPTPERQDFYQDREMTTRPLSRQRDGVNSPARNKYLWEKQKPFQTHTLARNPHALIESLQPQKTTCQHVRITNLYSRRDEAIITIGNKCKIPREKYNKTPGWSKLGSIAIPTTLFEAQNRAQYLSKRFETRIKIEKELQSRTNLDSQNTPQLMKERIQR